MNVTDKAYRSIKDIALRRGIDCPLVRVKLSYPQPDIRLIATEFVNDYSINIQCDVVDKLSDISFVMERSVHDELLEATLDIGNNNNQFFISWKKETNNETDVRGSKKDNGSRKKRKPGNSNRKNKSGDGSGSEPSVQYTVSEGNGTRSNI